LFSRLPITRETISKFEYLGQFEFILKINLEFESGVEVGAFEEKPEAK
jgi:hypothetical protein